MPTIEIDVNGTRRRVAVQRLKAAPGRYEVSWEGETRVVDVHAADSETLSIVEIDGARRSHTVRCEETDRLGGLDVHVDGVLVPLRVDTGRVDLTGRGAAGGPGGQRVVAPMPGKVVRLLVQPGDEVSEGQGVVVVEAMKMENQLTAPRAGRIAEVAVDEGASVEAGRVLVVLE